MSAPPCIGCGQTPHGPRTRRRAGAPGLRLTWFVLSGSSLGVLVLRALFDAPFDIFLVAFAAPATALLLAAAATIDWIDADRFVHNVKIGVVAGLWGTAAYDAIRLLMMWAGPFAYDAFYAPRLFGSWIVHRPPSTWEATFAGLAYHTWNGISFGLMYVLSFGRTKRRWYGITYGLVLELIMLGLFPMFLSPADRLGFITISLVGHALFGIVIGEVARRRAVPWLGPVT